MAGNTLVEVVTVAVLVGIAVSSVLPRFHSAVETTRVDRATAILRSIERAQRMFWIEEQRYATSLGELEGIGLIDSGVVEADTPFSFRIATADATTYIAEAERDDTSPWFGMISLDQDGDVTGSISNEEGYSVRPVY